MIARLRAWWLAYTAEGREMRRIYRVIGRWRAEHPLRLDRY